MRHLVAIAVSIPLAVLAVLAILTAVHSFGGLRTAKFDATEAVLPSPLEVDVRPLDRKRWRMSPNTTEARHVKTAALRGTLGAETRGYHVLLLAEGARGAIIRRTVAGAHGFDFGPVPTGRYQLRITDARRRPCTTLENYEHRDATPVELDLAPRTYEFRLAHEPVTGQPKPIEKARLMVSRDGILLADGRSDEHGRVSLQLSPGPCTWRIWVSGPDWPEETERRGELELGPATGRHILTFK